MMLFHSNTIFVSLKLSKKIWFAVEINATSMKVLPYELVDVKQSTYSI